MVGLSTCTKVGDAMSGCQAVPLGEGRRKAPLVSQPRVVKFVFTATNSDAVLNRRPQVVIARCFEARAWTWWGLNKERKTLR